MFVIIGAVPLNGIFILLVVTVPCTLDPPNKLVMVVLPPIETLEVVTEAWFPPPYTLEIVAPLKVTFVVVESATFPPPKISVAFPPVTVI